MNSKEWDNFISTTIEKYDLYGRSFTAGVALYKGVMDGWLNDEWDVIMDTIEEWTGKEYNTLRGAVEDTDLAILDEMARYFRGEEEEE